MGKNVIHVSTAHARDEVRIFQRQCLSLKSEGYNVSLIVADGLGNSVIDGITIYDVGASKNRFQRFLLLPFRMFAKAIILKADIYHYHEPELHLVALPLLWLKYKVIYDSHEDVPRAIMSRDWINKKFRKKISQIYEIIENFVCKRITGIIAATEHIAERFQKINKNTEVVFNFPIEKEYNTFSKRKRDEKQICYIGNISRNRGIIEMINGINGLDVRLTLVGKFVSAELELEVKQLDGWKNVDYRGFVSRKEVYKIMTSSVAGLLFFHPEPNHINSQPNKMFEYMSAGLPILASNFDLWKRIVSEDKCGICVDPLNKTEVRSAITFILKNPDKAKRFGENGLQAIHTKYNWKSAEKNLFEFYKKL